MRQLAAAAAAAAAVAAAAAEADSSINLRMTLYWLLKGKTPLSSLPEIASAIIVGDDGHNLVAVGIEPGSSPDTLAKAQKHLQACPYHLHLF